MRINFSLLFLIGFCIMNIKCMPECKNKRKIKYLFITDRVSPDIIDKFNGIFYNGESEGMRLSQSQHEGISEIGFAFFIASNAEIPYFEASFFCSNEDKDSRKKISDNFINKLADIQSKENKISELYILSAFNKALEYISDKSTKYKVIFLSSMIENSGGPIADINVPARDDTATGYFHFINEEKFVLCSYLNAAKSQIKDKESWIYRHLVAKTFNPENVDIIVMKQNVAIYNRPEHRCDDRSIDEFWKDLFAAMKVKVQWQNGGLNQYDFSKDILD